MFARILAFTFILGLAAACSSTSQQHGKHSSSSGSLKGNNGRIQHSHDLSSSELAEIGDRVHFSYDSSVLSQEAQDILNMQAEWLRENPYVTVTVEGHCDERGTREYNLGLGDRRAVAVKNYLIGLGIGNERLSTISYGKERPAVLGANQTAWGLNRRAVVVVNR